jgi:hypothetical protein
MNVRNRLQDDQWNGMKWLSEEAMVQVQWIAPIFASVGIDGWPGFPPLNWYSDNVACDDMAKDGFVHFPKPFLCPPCLLAQTIRQRRGCRP